MGCIPCRNAKPPHCPRRTAIITGLHSVCSNLHDLGQGWLKAQVAVLRTASPSFKHSKAVSSLPVLTEIQGPSLHYSISCSTTAHHGTQKKREGWTCKSFSASLTPQQRRSRQIAPCKGRARKAGTAFGAGYTCGACREALGYEVTSMQLKAIAKYSAGRQGRLSGKSV